MNTIQFIKKVRCYLLHSLTQQPRIVKFNYLSTCQNIIGKPIKFQPVQINGKGTVTFSQNVHLGVKKSPFLYSGYIYIDVRNSDSTISFKDSTCINNNCIFISEGAGIEIGENTLIGFNTEILDSDFHSVNPHNNRKDGTVRKSKVVISKNVFIGNNVKILKGVHIGENTVIANGSVVTKSIPANSIAAGVPAKVIREI